MQRAGNAREARIAFSMRTAEVRDGTVGGAKSHCLSDRTSLPAQKQTGICFAY
ncbi:MAG TPA: hypothetical protein VN361_01020 [Oxalicibacterium sp.]|nr:hypothetical protein [Oxalicibacterium sp.]